MQVELSVIIVNFNGLKYLEKCFNSLYENLKDISFEIVVIDNNSTDQSCNYIKENYPEIVLVPSKQNLGFGKGNNEAVKKAQGRYLLLINNDTIVLDKLSPIIDVLDNDKSIGVVGINMLDAHKKYLSSVGNFPNPKNMLQIKKIFDVGEEFKTGKFTKNSYEVDWLTGSFLFLPKVIYEKVGGFDEDYFMYVEDVDFCKKIAEEGYKRIFLKQFQYIHFVGFNKSKNPLVIKGCEIYISKHLKGINKFACLLAIKTNKIVKKIKKALKLD